MAANITQEIGYISEYFSGVAKVQGLPHALLYEVLLDKEQNEQAMVIGFQEDYVEVLLFDDNWDLEKPLYKSNRLFSIPISEKYAGRIINGLGKPQDKFGPINGTYMSVFRGAPYILDRSAVERPIETGIKIIDTALPLGKGQRELIVGDRKLGKSTIGLDIVLNQRHTSPQVYCIYVLCGQKPRQLQELIHLLKTYNALPYTTVVEAPAHSSFANQFLAPFIGCTLGEYYRDKGKDAIIVYDDLSKHAKVYRSISLLLERAPGREAYPGDIFSIHAQLLERAAQLNKQKGGGSLTALPIVETQEGDITSFIPTNIISITDGQIYLERGLFQKNFMPAINVGLSVSRIGSRAQSITLKEVTTGIRLALAQHTELQKLTQLETVVSKATQQKILRGELILELLKQDKHQSLSTAEQSVLFYAVEKGYFDTSTVKNWTDLETYFLDLLHGKYATVLDKLEHGTFTPDIEKRIDQCLTEFKQKFFSNSL